MNPEFLRPVADHLWQSTVFAGIAGLLTLALRANHARVRHWVWFAASCKFLVPVSLLIALGGSLSWRASAPLTSRVDLSLAIHQVSQPFTAGLPVSIARNTAPSHTNPVPEILLGIWVCGFICIAISWWVRWRRIRAVVRSGSPMDLALPIRVVSSPAPIEPGVFGIFSPVLLLPDGIFDRLTRAQLDAVIAHELCHFRHRDNLVAAVQMFVETVFWFHPLIWCMGKQMTAERERGCDEEVIRMGNRPQVYAEGILNVCKLYTESPLQCMSGVTGSDLKKRIQAILARNCGAELSFMLKVTLATLGAVCLALPVLIGAWNAPPLMGRSEISVPLVPKAGVKFRSVTIERCRNYYRLGQIENPAPGRFLFDCFRPVDLIYMAWLGTPADARSVYQSQQVLPLSGDPTWLSANYSYRIDARADPGTSLAMIGPMMQTLLADHFGLVIRRVTRSVPMFSLVAPAGGNKLRKSGVKSCNGDWSGSNRPPPPPMRGMNNCVSFVGRTGQYMTLVGQGTSLGDFCTLLSNPMGAQVIDKTGINGKFDFRLEFAGKDTPGALGQLYPPLPEVLDAQLGLKLQRITGPREFLVIDKVVKPVPD